MISDASTVRVMRTSRPPTELTDPTGKASSPAKSPATTICPCRELARCTATERAVCEDVARQRVANRSAPSGA